MIDIADMNDFHLVASYQKVCREIFGPTLGVTTDADLDNQLMMIALLREIRRRGLDPMYKGGKPPEAR